MSTLSISISLDDQSLQKYQSVSVDMQKSMVQLVQLMLYRLLNNSSRTLLPFADDISSETTGLTPEMLDAALSPLAVSLPDELFVTANDFARTIGISRTELYTSAIREYIIKHKRADVIEQINTSCDKVDTSLPDDIAAVTRKKLLEVEW